MIKDSYLMVDAVVQKDNVFTRMDARIKVVCCLLALGAVIGLSGVKLPLTVTALAVAVMVMINIPARLMLGRILAPLTFGLGIFLFMLFFRGGEPLFTLHLAGFKLAGYREGFALGSAILTRILASISILLFLSVTTPVHELGYALIWLRVPKVIVEILQLTYRYLFVLWEEGMRIRQAQTMRLGYPGLRSISGWKQVIRSTSTLMAMVFIRAYDRAEATFSAMQVRAFNGSITGSGLKSWSRTQTQYLITSLCILMMLILVTL